MVDVISLPGSVSRQVFLVIFIFTDSDSTFKWWVLNEQGKLLPDLPGPESGICEG